MYRPSKSVSATFFACSHLPLSRLIGKGQTCFDLMYVCMYRPGTQPVSSGSEDDAQVLNRAYQNHISPRHMIRDTVGTCKMHITNGPKADKPIMSHHFDCGAAITTYYLVGP